MKHLCLAAMALVATPAFAQTFLSGPHSIDGGLCAGTACTNSETFDELWGIKIKQTGPGIYFDDTSNTDHPDRDWTIEIGSKVALSPEYFGIRDVLADTLPFQVRGDAPDNAFFVAADGKIGFGTMLPLDELHISTPASGTGLTLETTGVSASAWTMDVGANGYVLGDRNAATNVFVLENGTPSNSAVIKDTGFVGLGTASPEGKLHTKGDGVQLAYFESGDGGPVQIRFRSDSENRRFLAVDNADNVKTQMQFRDDAILFLGQTVAQEWLRVDATGITTAGPSCSSPCDLTFDPEVFTVPPIEERAAYMWQNMHLPAIGPTTSDRPINLTEKVGGVIHELEVAHIYIEQLHARIETMESQAASQNALNAKLLQRLEALETR